MSQAEERVVKAWLLADRIKRLLKKAAEEENTKELRDVLMQADMLSVSLMGLVKDVLEKRTKENMRIEKKQEEKQEERATESQISYIKDLCTKIGEAWDEEQLRKLSKKEASELIEKLKKRAWGSR
jgi:tRNA A37 threonylcarbamoyltransferase TsaD